MEGNVHDSAVAESICPRCTARIALVVWVPKAAVIDAKPSESACMRVLLGAEMKTTVGESEANVARLIT